LRVCGGTTHGREAAYQFGGNRKEGGTIDHEEDRKESITTV